MPVSSRPDTDLVLGEGLLEVDYPLDLLNPASYRFDRAVALNPSETYERTGNVELPADLEGADGVLVAAVVEPPRLLGFVDKLARQVPSPHGGMQDTPSPAQGSELALGSGAVRLERHMAGGRPAPGERTAITVGDALDADVVRSLLGIKVRLLLRAAD